MRSRLIQSALILTTILAMLAASVSACTCAHHEAEPVTEVSSCHHHSEMSDMAVGGEATEQTVNNFLALDEDCICAASEQKATAKFEAVKLKKQAVLVSLKTSITAAPIRLIAAVNVGSVEPNHLPDRVSDSSQSRGPPRL